MQSPPTSSTSPDSPFLHGLTRSSRAALALTALVAVSWFGLCALAITPSAIARHAGYFAESGRDVNAFVSARVLGLTESRPDGPVLFLFGNSSLVAGIGESEALARDLRERGAGGLEVIDLMTLGQSYLDVAALADRIPPGFEGLVVLPVNPLMLTRDALLESREQFGDISGRLGLRSDFMEARAELEGADFPARTGNYFLDNRRFFLPRLTAIARNLCTGPVARHASDEWPWLERHWSAADLADNSATRRRVIDLGYGSRAGLHLALLAEIVAMLRERHDLEFALVETLVHPEILAGYTSDGIVLRHRQRIEAFAAEHGLTYWHLDELDFSAEEFHDPSHLCTDGARARFRAALANRIAALSL